MSKSESPASANPVSANTDTAFVAKKRVVCDGGGGALGHPRTWLDMGTDNQVECKYCDRLFIYDVDKAV